MSKYYSCGMIGLGNQGLNHSEMGAKINPAASYGDQWKYQLKPGVEGKREG